MTRLRAIVNEAARVYGIDLGTVPAQRPAEPVSGSTLAGIRERLLAGSTLSVADVRVGGSDPAGRACYGSARRTVSSGSRLSQFDAGRRPLAVVLTVNQLLLGDRDPWGVTSWWLTANVWLDGSPAPLGRVPTRHSSPPPASPGKGSEHVDPSSPNPLPRPAQLGVLPSGTQLWRVHRADRDVSDYRKSGAHPYFGPGRFDAMPPDEFPFLYAADHDTTALAEVMLRDLPYDQVGDVLLPWAALQGLMLSCLEITAPLQLVSLVSAADLAAVAQDVRLVNNVGDDQAWSRHWTQWLRHTVPGAQAWPGNPIATVRAPAT